MNYWLKQCPRCRGDLHQELDSFGPYISCVQCGYILKQEEEAHLLAGVTPKEDIGLEKAAA